MSNDTWVATVVAGSFQGGAFWFLKLLYAVSLMGGLVNPQNTAVGSVSGLQGSVTLFAVLATGHEQAPFVPIFELCAVPQCTMILVTW